jgi:hypothetical protein
MLRICCVCKKIISCTKDGDTTTVTHGYCKECEAAEHKKIDALIAQKKEQTEEE